MEARHIDLVEFEIAELVDLELQLLEDEQARPRDIHRRDREIGLSLKTVTHDRGLLFLSWLDKVRKPEDSVGARVQTALSRLRWILLVLGFFMGSGAASALLIYDGEVPVNINRFLEVFVLFQLILLLLLLLSVSSKGANQWLPGVGTVQKFLRSLVLTTGRSADWLMGRLPEGRAAGLKQQVARLQELESWFAKGSKKVGRLKGWQSLYGDVERWSLIELTQCFSMAFNVGAMVAFLRIIVFSNVAFGWSTTLFSGADHFQAIIQGLALPWSWFWADAVPSAELIKKSEFFFDNKAFEARDSGAWWPFLMACLMFYGLLPRLIFWLLARFKGQRALREVPLDSARFQSLYERLTRPYVSLDRPPPESPRARPSKRLAPVSSPRMPVRSKPALNKAPTTTKPVQGPTDTQPATSAKPADTVSSVAAVRPSVEEPAPKPPPESVVEEPVAAVEEPVAVKEPVEPALAPEASNPEPVAPVWSCQTVVWEGGWLDAVDSESLLYQYMGWRQLGFGIAGEDIDEDEELLEALPRTLSGDDFVVLLVESWVVPSRDVVGFLDDLREALGDTRSLVIALLRKTPEGGFKAPTDAERACWVDKVDERGDPYMRLESVLETQ